MAGLRYRDLGPKEVIKCSSLPRLSQLSRACHLSHRSARLEKFHFIQTVMVIDTPKSGNLALNLTHEFVGC